MAKRRTTYFHQNNYIIFICIFVISVTAMKDDRYYLDYCRTLGRAAAEKGNPPVGALIVNKKEGKIAGKAEEASKSKNDITCHAEIEAIRDAVKKLQSNDLSDCILFTSHEPCIMCAYAIRFYKIKKVVFAEAMDYLGSITSSMPLLSSTEVPAHWSAPPEIVQKKKI